MNFLSPFFESIDSSNAFTARISAQQGNNFAKLIANDFNPIHDTDSKRFCVPGDLLFALTVGNFGIAECMKFGFAELVKADSELSWPKALLEQAMEVKNQRDKAVLKFEYSGSLLKDAKVSEQLIRHYVVFSGQNFPDILVPLMQKEGVMINPARPLVIYEQMSVEFSTLDIADITLKLASTSLNVSGKRGDAWLNFDILSGQKTIGCGKKKLVLSGLREYHEASVQSMCDAYEAARLQAA